MPLERYGFDFRGQSQLEKFMGGIQNVRTPILKGAHSKVIPAAPLAIDVVVVVIVMPRGCQPQIRIKRRGNGLSLWKPLNSGIPGMPASRAVHVCRNDGYVFNH